MLVSSPDGFRIMTDYVQTRHPPAKQWVAKWRQRFVLSFGTSFSFETVVTGVCWVQAGDGANQATVAAGC
jgi:hypothetical protein